MNFIVSSVGTFEWSLGILFVAVFSLIGRVYVMSERAREELEEQLDKRSQELWGAIEKVTDSFQQHRGEVLQGMVTKSDLAAMETRIMRAIRDHRQGAD